jgi:serine/threonine protein phosphatase PrpC
MGNLLEVPATKKESTIETMTEKDFTIEAGISGMQGYRKEMEDQHIHTRLNSAPDHLFLGVFDGHGGKGCAIYVCGTDPNRSAEDKCLYEILEETTEWKDYIASGKGGASKDIKLLENALVAAFKEIDTRMQAYVKENPYKAYTFGGCTAVTVMITPEWIVCANAGDSRATMSKVRGPALTLSEDHKPTNPEEQARIEKAGGYVSNGRVDGNLAVSRGLGDFEFKMDAHINGQEAQRVSCIPEFFKYPRDVENEEMIIIACDGLWDVFSNQDAIDLVRGIWNDGEKDIQKVAEEMIDLAMFKGSEDNISAIIVKLKGASVASVGGGVEARREKRPDRGAKGRDYDLHSSAKFNDLEKVRQCIERENYDSNEREDNTGKTALYLASEHRNMEIIDELLGKYGADRHIPDANGLFPIHIAARNGHADVVARLLRDNDGDVNLADKTPQSRIPIDYAREGDHQEVVGLLLSRGSSDATTSSGP